MASQAATAVVVDSVVMKILHAHSFARTSSQAILRLWPVELAGRSSLTIHDFVACLDELGTNLDELSEYCGTEGVELSRYASSSAKRLDDLGDFRSYIGEGLVPRDDPIPLHYAPLPEDASVILEDDEESDSDGDGLVPVEAVNHFTEPLSYRQHPIAAFLADFLPPFPDASQPQPPSPAPGPHTVIMERPSSPLPQHITSITAGDYLIQVPYSESVLAGTPSWHLPSEPSETRPSKPQPPRFSTPSPQQALLAAYHHILTHLVSQPGPPNPAKHKVAMALLSQVQQNTQWDAPPTLYANVTPCPPPVTSIGPSYPIALSALEDLFWRRKELRRFSLAHCPPTLFIWRSAFLAGSYLQFLSVSIYRVQDRRDNIQLSRVIHI
ncbi:hypothetical protein L210DRAFT_1056629 [Boletus edulis BED1]|uniref:Uncharacterized protein n=1 Tax=Boletus edulis BED1 TaxID=1328754 RepID=A0AAD4C7L9_BOLED|nr:hypothetical protein L210DRAFT_1056629 [Boletus edulis BED1]